MNWNGIGHFLSMGGYAWFVWGSYGAVALAFAAEIVLMRARRRRARDAVLAQPPSPEP